MWFATLQKKKKNYTLSSYTLSRKKSKFKINRQVATFKNNKYKLTHLPWSKYLAYDTRIQAVSNHQMCQSAHWDCICSSASSHGNLYPSVQELEISRLHLLRDLECSPIYQLFLGSCPRNNHGDLDMENWHHQFWQNDPLKSIVNNY